MAEENKGTPGVVTMTQAQADQLARGYQLLAKLSTDPRTQGLIDEAVKVHHPEVTTEKERVEQQVSPLLKPVTETLERINKRFEDEDAAKKASEEKAAEARIESSFVELAKQGYTAEGLEKIKALMIDRSIADPYAAAALFDKQNPPAPDAAAYTPANWDLGAGHAPGDSLKELFANEDAWAEKQIGVVLNEMRSGQ